MSKEVAVKEQKLKANAELPPMIARVSEEGLARARSIVITTDEQLSLAETVAHVLKTEWEMLDEERARLKKPFLDGGAAIDDHYRGPIKTLKEAVETVKVTMLTYRKQVQIEFERKAKAEEEARRREQEARRKAEEEAHTRAIEAQRAADKAELDRQTAAKEAAQAEAAREKAARAEAEARASADQAALKRAEQATAEAKENERRAKEEASDLRKKALQAAMDKLRAEETAQQATATAAIEPAKTVSVAPKFGGGSTRKKYGYKIKGAVPANYMTIDHEKIQATVDRLKDIAQETLGDWVEVTVEESLALGRKT